MHQIIHKYRIVIDCINNERKILTHYDHCDCMALRKIHAKSDHYRV